MFDLNNLNPSSRFFFDGKTEADPKSEYVDLKIASDAEVNEMRKAAGIKQKIEYLENSKTHKKERSEYLETSEENMEKLNELINDFAIESWRLFDQNGDEIPCTLENKKLLMAKSPKFSTFVANNLTIMREEQEKAYNKETKNS